MSFFIAELFYKFHSFTRETLAFLATWGVILDDMPFAPPRRAAGG
jgi:hypothetical protein